MPTKLGSVESVRKAWQKVCIDEKQDRFSPEQESDIVCLLYHYLVEGGLRPDEIYTEVGIRLSNKPYYLDFLIDSGKGQNDSWDPLLVGEVKLKWSAKKGRTQDAVNSPRWAKEQSRRLLPDRLKLVRVQKRYPNAQAVQLVFFTSEFKKNYKQTYQKTMSYLKKRKRKDGIEGLFS